MQQRAANTHGVADTLAELASLAGEQGDTERAASLYEASLALYRSLGDIGGMAANLTHLAAVQRIQGNGGRAGALGEESVVLQRTLGDKGGLAEALKHLGATLHLQGDDAHARALYAESLLLCWQLGHRVDAAHCLDGLASISGAQGRPERAARLLDPTAPAVYSWIGVTMYLSLQAIRATLATVAAGPPGTQIVLTHNLPPAALQGLGLDLGTTLGRRLAELGEPMISLFEPAEIERLLREVGFAQIVTIDQGAGSPQSRTLPHDPLCGWLPSGWYADAHSAGASWPDCRTHSCCTSAGCRSCSGPGRASCSH